MTLIYRKNFVQNLREINYSFTPKGFEEELEKIRAKYIAKKDLC